MHAACCLLQRAEFMVVLFCCFQSLFALRNSCFYYASCQLKLAERENSIGIVMLLHDFIKNGHWVLIAFDAETVVAAGLCEHHCEESHLNLDTRKMDNIWIWLSTYNHYFQIKWKIVNVSIPSATIHMIGRSVQRHAHSASLI